MHRDRILKMLYSNRELIQRNTREAIEDLHTLKRDYAHVTDEEVLLNFAYNNSLVEMIFHSDHQRSIDISLQALEQFPETPHYAIVAWHNWLIGHNYAIWGKHGQAEEHLKKALALVEHDNTFTGLMMKSDCYHILAMNNELAGLGSNKSMNYLKLGLDILPEKKTEVRRANLLMGMGNICLNTDKLAEALEYYHEAALTYEHHYDLPNMAAAYSNIGTCYIKLNELAQAETFLQRSLDLRLRFGSPEHISISYYNLAIVYRDKGDYKTAESLLLKSKEILKRSGSIPYMEMTQTMLQEVQALMNKT
ncbi:MAG: tetratricopeptide repeat protein [Chitinophagales bacterium]